MAGFLAAACAAWPDDLCAGGACVMSADATTDVQTPPGCDDKADPKDSPLCLDDSYAVFIDSVNGVDAADGTKAAPVKTIGHALTLLGGRPRIYICGTGTLDEHVVLTSATSLIGGYNCGTWDYRDTPNNKATIKPHDAGYALKISSVPSSISDLAFEAQAGANAGDSSIAVFASGSDVTFRRCSLTAQAGAVGSPGSKGVNGVWSDPAGGGAGVMCTCTTGGSTTGGAGGDVGGSGKDGLPSIAGNVTESNGAAGVGNQACGVGGTGAGHNGGDSPSGANAAANSSLGQLTANGWLPGDGLDGTDGQPGQGGGGGGGRAGAGGGGGCGGCGGTKGTAGNGGGSSVALLSYQSTVQLIGCALTTNQAGSGGSGGNGGDANEGFAGDPGSTPSPAGCGGGDGGSGGAGGAGSGGAGGISAGVLYSGSAPVPDTETTIHPGAAGVRGVAGMSGSPSVVAGNQGLDGKSGQMVSADDWTVTP